MSLTHYLCIRAIVALLTLTKNILYTRSLLHLLTFHLNHYLTSLRPLKTSTSITANFHINTTYFTKSNWTATNSNFIGYQSRRSSYLKCRQISLAVPSRCISPTPSSYRLLPCLLIRSLRLL